MDLNFPNFHYDDGNKKKMKVKKRVLSIINFIKLNKHGWISKQ